MLFQEHLFCVCTDTNLSTRQNARATVPHLVEPFLAKFWIWISEKTSSTAHHVPHCGIWGREDLSITLSQGRGGGLYERFYPWSAIHSIRHRPISRRRGMTPPGWGKA